MKLLITSIGSLVAQNILDVLEFPAFSRRSLMQVVGMNSLPDAAGNFRCDRCYLVPETATAEYPARAREILLEESPDLILCSRDEDTLALSQLKAQHPELPGALPVGEPRAMLVGLDKWQTWLFARRHGLPYAESFMPGEPGNETNLEAFCERVGYPVVAKPTRGSASRGVYFVRDPRDARLMAQRQDYLFQEYLGDPLSLNPYFASFQGPLPLFAHSQVEGHYSCQTVIARNGQIAPVFVMYNQHEYGQSVRHRRISDSTLDALTLAYGRAFVTEGGAGPLNVAFRRDRHGNWKVMEINLRNTGATLARFLLGMDELYFIVRDFVPSVSFPELHPHGIDQVGKYLYSYPVSDSAVATLKSSNVWPRS